MAKDAQVTKIKGFFAHLRVYIIVNIILIVVNLFTSPSYWWSVWPLLFWGIGLFFHYMNTFPDTPIDLTRKWEMEALKKEKRKR